MRTGRETTIMQELETIKLQYNVKDFWDLVNMVSPIRMKQDLLTQECIL